MSTPSKAVKDTADVLFVPLVSLRFVPFSSDLFTAWLTLTFLLIDLRGPGGYAERSSLEYVVNSYIIQ